MESGFLHSHEHWLRRYGLACLWLWSIPVFTAGEFEAQYWASAWYGPAQPYLATAVLASLVLSGIAVLLLYLIIRPWSFHFSRNRLLVSLIIFLGGFFVVSGGISDPPGLQNAYMVWLLSVIIVLSVALFLTNSPKRDTRSDVQKRDGASHV